MRGADVSPAPGVGGFTTAGDAGAAAKLPEPLPAVQMAGQASVFQIHLGQFGQIPQPSFLKPPELAVNAALCEGHMDVEALACLTTLLHKEGMAAAELA